MISRLALWMRVERTRERIATGSTAAAPIRDASERAAKLPVWQKMTLLGERKRKLSDGLQGPSKECINLPKERANMFIVLGLVLTCRRMGCEFSGDQVRQDQVRSGQIRSDQVRSDQVRSGQIRSGLVAVLRLKMLRDEKRRRQKQDGR